MIDYKASKPIDLGLTYEQALHGMQTAVAYEMNLPDREATATNPKHLRVGINSAHVSDQALAMLLIDKGVFTMEELNDQLRLAANDEVARYERLHRGITFR